MLRAKIDREVPAESVGHIDLDSCAQVVKTSPLDKAGKRLRLTGNHPTSSMWC
jgi:hypothetical protein